MRVDLRRAGPARTRAICSKTRCLDAGLRYDVCCSSGATERGPGEFLERRARLAPIGLNTRELAQNSPNPRRVWPKSSACTVTVGQVVGNFVHLEREGFSRVRRSRRRAPSPRRTAAIFACCPGLDGMAAITVADACARKRALSRAPTVIFGEGGGEEGEGGEDGLKLRRPLLHPAPQRRFCERPRWAQQSMRIHRLSRSCSCAAKRGFTSQLVLFAELVRG